jgi:hypothetical protein
MMIAPPTQVMFVSMIGMEPLGRNVVKTLMERHTVIILDMQSPCLMMVIQWPLVLLIMEVWVMSVFMIGMEPTGHNVGKTLTEKLLMTILDIQFLFPVTQTLLLLVLTAMMALFLAQVMFVCMTGMDPTGPNVDQTLMVKLQMTILDIRSPCPMMETPLQLALVIMMAMALIRVMFVCMTGMDPTGPNADQTLMEKL